jgi:prepilin-type N-terminal cleavage/methylation domain-containing protein
MMRFDRPVRFDGGSFRALRGSARAARSRGFSLVEVIVAIALFGVSMSAIGALTFAVTRQSARTVGTVERTAALEASANDLFSIAWADIPGRVGCTTITAPPFPRTQCISTVALSATRRTVTLTVTPTDASIQPTSISVERTQPPSANPFKVAP